MADRAEGGIYLVGAGPGDPSLLTVRARHVLAAAQSAVVDPSVGTRVQDTLPAEAYVRHSGGGDLSTPEQVAAYLAAQARQGRLAVRLYAGDGWRNASAVAEREALRRLGVCPVLVPGVASEADAVAREGLPMGAVRVLVTRPPHQGEELVELLARRGAEVWHIPTIVPVAPRDPGAVLDALGRLGTYQWLVFTSVNGVEWFFRFLRASQRDVRELFGIRLVAIGPKTAAALGERHLYPLLVPQEYRAEALVAAMGPLVAPGDRVLVARAESARPVLVEALRDRGAQVDELALYRTEPAPGVAQRMAAFLAGEGVRVITFTSSSTVTYLVRQVPVERLAGCRVACIGPVTAETARQAGLPVHRVAQEYTVEGLAEAVASLVVEEQQQDRGTGHREGGTDTHGLS